MTKRALNHMAAPRHDWADLIQLAKALDCVGVEFRNDLDGDLFDGAAPKAVGETVAAAGLRILALAEVKAFDDWSDSKRDEAAALASIAHDCGAEMLSLIARNDGMAVDPTERKTNLRKALVGLKPVLEEHGLIGLIEPLGFKTCSLRFKNEVVEAIEEVGGLDRFRIVHDTFHHAVAGGGEIFPALTGIVHVSGVPNTGIDVEDFEDPMRILVDENDRLQTTLQVAQLLDGGYDGPISFEPFAPEVHALQDPESAYRRSFAYIDEQLARVNAA